MRFYDPKVLWMASPVLGLLPVAWLLLEMKAAERFARFATAPLLSQMLKGGDSKQIARRRRARFLFGWLGLLFVVIALARPQIGVREETLQSEGLDIVFALDVSNSMLAEDVVPSRIKKAKHVIKNFVDRLSGDRAGVIAFAGSAYPAVPLTTDYDFIRQTLEGLDENSVGNQGTDLAGALKVASDMLVRGGVNEINDQAHEADASDGASRVIVLLSDGEATEGQEQAKLAPKLKEAGIKVFSIGVGSLKGSPIPLRDQNGYMRGYKKDPAGNMVLTKLETASLEAISSKTGGNFYSASSNEGEVEEIVGELSTLDRSRGGTRKVIVYDEIFQYPLAVGILLLMLMLALREAVARAKSERSTEAKNNKMASAVGVFIVFGGCLTDARAATSYNEYSATKRGVDAFEAKDYATAIQEFGKAQADNPDSAQHHMNLGAALLKSGSAEGAIPEFEAVLKGEKGTESARGAYNLGKAFEEGKDYERALRAYQEGLSRLAQDPAPDSEVEMRIKRALEQAQNKKQQQQQQQQNKDNDQNGQGQGKDNQDNQSDKKKDQAQNYKIPKRKPEFKPEKITENDAKRILKQLQEQEKKSQQRVMRSKTGNPKDEKNDKDW